MVILVMEFLVLAFGSESEATPRKPYNGLASLFSSDEVTITPVVMFTVKLMGKPFVKGLGTQYGLSGTKKGLGT